MSGIAVDMCLLAWGFSMVAWRPERGPEGRVLPEPIRLDSGDGARRARTPGGEFGARVDTI